MTTFKPEDAQDARVYMIGDDGRLCSRPYEPSDEGRAIPLADEPGAEEGLWCADDQWFVRTEDGEDLPLRMWADGHI